MPAAPIPGASAGDAVAGASGATVITTGCEDPGIASCSPCPSTIDTGVRTGPAFCATATGCGVAPGATTVACDVAPGVAVALGTTVAPCATVAPGVAEALSSDVASELARTWRSTISAAFRSGVAAEGADPDAR